MCGKRTEVYGDWNRFSLAVIKVKLEIVRLTHLLLYQFATWSDLQFSEYAKSKDSKIWGYICTPPMKFAFNRAFYSWTFKIQLFFSTGNAGRMKNTCTLNISWHKPDLNHWPSNLLCKGLTGATVGYFLSQPLAKDSTNCWAN